MPSRESSNCPQRLHRGFKNAIAKVILVWASKPIGPPALRRVYGSEAAVPGWWLQTRGIRRRHLLIRERRLLRVDGRQAPHPTGGRHRLTPTERARPKGRIPAEAGILPVDQALDYVRETAPERRGPLTNCSTATWRGDGPYPSLLPKLLARDLDRAPGAVGATEGFDFDPDLCQRSRGI
jgi:hypothetical protein